MLCLCSVLSTFETIFLQSTLLWLIVHIKSKTRRSITKSYACTHTAAHRRRHTKMMSHLRCVRCRCDHIKRVNTYPIRLNIGLYHHGYWLKKKKKCHQIKTKSLSCFLFISFFNYFFLSLTT